MAARHGLYGNVHESNAVEGPDHAQSTAACWLRELEHRHAAEGSRNGLYGLECARKGAGGPGQVVPRHEHERGTIAGGQPQIISSMSTPNGPFIIWEYYRKRTITTPSARREFILPRSSTPVPENLLFPNTGPAFSSSVVESLDRSAVFHNEQLVNWSPK